LYAAAFAALNAALRSNCGRKDDVYMKIAVITGASSGLGRELAVSAAGNFPGIDVFWLIARNEGRLQETAKLIEPEKAEIIPLDLSKVSSLGLLEEKLKNEKPEIGLLINDAGVCFMDNLGEGSLSEQLQMVDLNVRALMALTHLCIPYIANGGKIINISSIAGFCAIPRMSVYSSAKAFVNTLSRALTEELRPRKISVTCVCPSPMDTPILVTGNLKGRSKKFDSLPTCDPRKVADGAIRACLRGRAMFTPRLFNKLVRTLAKLLPAALMVKLMKV